ncbi:Myc box-dependent-interacting protein 1 [Nymphon striatum]|nr:Myc box-dependent-interacting protein 1 [Nymphon striatum]
MSDDLAKKNIMADSKGGFFSKTVQKHAGRAKERRGSMEIAGGDLCSLYVIVSDHPIEILQNLGKADKTRDELFDEYLNNFNKQQYNLPSYLCEELSEEDYHVVLMFMKKLFVLTYFDKSNAATKLHKEIRHYTSCIKEMQAANKSMFETLVHVYDPEWLGHEQLYIRSQHIDMVWNDYSHKLNDQIMIPLQTYLNQFPDIKEKIGKRGRKLVDYDRQRHNFEALQNNPKKRDDVKVTKSKEQLDDAKKMYEILNNELHDDLPALYDSRIPFMVSNFQTLFTAETVFHNEVSKVYAQLVDMMEKLAMENQKGTYMQRKPDSPSQKRERTYEEIDVKQQDVIKEDDDADPAATTNGEESAAQPNQASPKSSTPGGREDLPKSSSPSAHTRSVTMARKGLKKYVDLEGSQPAGCRWSPFVAKLGLKSLTDDSVVMHETTNNSSSSSSLTASTAATTTATNDNDKPEPEVNFQVNSSTDNKNNNTSSAVPSPTRPTGPTGPTPANELVFAKKVEELYDIPVGATTTNLPEGVLFRVKSTYKYVSEDADELSLEPNEIIQVIEFEEVEEQEDGWLMGVKEENGERGLFPANFTRPI